MVVYMIFCKISSYPKEAVYNGCIIRLTNKVFEGLLFRFFDFLFFIKVPLSLKRNGVEWKDQRKEISYFHGLNF